MMELELRQLDRKYASLRVLAADRLGALVASLAEAGQQTPVLVVVGGQGPVLIDGYRRVAGLQRLGRDTVQALQLELGEAQALVLRHRMAADERRSALEDGWLLRELQDGHGVTQRELGLRLQRSASWVCRRLGLVSDLPESAQDLVRRGEVPAQASMKYLLPLSRANKGACERLAASLAGQRWSVREVEAVYTGWRKSPPEQRKEIEARPRLYCQALAEVHKPLPVDDPQAHDLAVALTRLGSAASRLRGLVRERLREKATLEPADMLAGLWNDAETRIAELRKTIHQGLGHAG
jgi:ParB/RepB/Spo0J family partition protein